ncbi:hypothetical protein SALBM135S_09368 [Streptomyces alboniger]
MKKVALRPHALLPRQYDHQKVLATTVDAWREQAVRDSHLRVSQLDALPNGRFVVQGHSTAAKARCAGTAAATSDGATRSQRASSTSIRSTPSTSTTASRGPTTTRPSRCSRYGPTVTPDYGELRWSLPRVWPCTENTSRCGGGDRQPDRLHRCRLTESEALPVEEARLTLPNGAALTRYARPVGRGRHLYLRGTSPRQWYVMSVQDPSWPLASGHRRRWQAAGRGRRARPVSRATVPAAPVRRRPLPASRRPGGAVDRPCGLRDPLGDGGAVPLGPHLHPLLGRLGAGRFPVPQ